jgi:ABC-type branched-subunit amino acid transport system substrate-binding protein
MVMRSVLGVFVLFLAGCSLLVAKEQCRVTSDCRARGQAFEGHVCSPEGYCVPLLAPPACPTVLSSHKDGAITDDTILLGHIAARGGTLEALGKGSERAAELALHEWGLHQGGAPVERGAPARPLAVVLCDEANAEVAARHLVQTLHAPALFGGPISSERTRDIAERVTIPGGTLLLASFSAAPEISRLGELVWRTAQSTDAESTAMALFIGRLARALRQKDAGLNKVRIFSFYQDDLYGNGLQGALVNRLPDAEYERSPYLLPADKNDEKDAAKLKEALMSAANQPPHIVTLLGTGGLIGRILVPLETLWPAGKPRPIYLVPEGMKDPALPRLAQRPDLGELYKRLYVFSPRVDPALADKYRDRFMARFPGQPIGSPATYDAMYLIGYSLVALGGKPVTGANLAAGMRRMIPGPGGAKKIIAGPTRFNEELGGLLEGVTELQAGKNINYQGVSGELDFDLATGDPEGDYSIECTTSTDFKGTGLAYTALLNRSNLLGTYQEASCPCVTCPTTP